MCLHQETSSCCSPSREAGMRRKGWGSVVEVCRSLTMMRWGSDAPTSDGQLHENFSYVWRSYLIFQGLLSKQIVQQPPILLMFIYCHRMHCRMHRVAYQNSKKMFQNHKPKQFNTLIHRVGAKMATGSKAWFTLWTLRIIVRWLITVKISDDLFFRKKWRLVTGYFR